MALETIILVVRDDVEGEFEAAQPKTLKEAREEIERAMVQNALRRHRNKISPAATELGISRPTFYELMDKLGIEKET